MQLVYVHSKYLWNITVASAGFKSSRALRGVGSTLSPSCKLYEPEAGLEAYGLEAEPEARAGFRHFSPAKAGIRHFRH